MSEPNSGEILASDPPPNDGEVQPVELIAICHTGGCPVEGQEFTGWYYPAGNHVPPVYNGYCGRCGQRINDLQPPA